MEEIKFEPMRTVGEIQTTNIILSKMYGVPRLKKSPESSEVLLEVPEDTASPFLCRLCATRGIDMVHMFGANKLHKNITQKIKDCSLPIVVKKTDTLPKYACRICLGKLELCYQFHKTVAEAEKQLLTYNRQTKSSKIEEAEENRQALPVYNGQRSARKLASNGKILKSSTQTCRTKNLCKSRRTRRIRDKYKKNDSSTDSSNTNQTAPIDQNNTLNSPNNTKRLGEELRSEKKEYRPDSEFYSPPFTRSQSQTVCDRKKKKKIRKHTKNDDNIFFWEKKYKNKSPKLNGSMKTIGLRKKLRSEKEKEVSDSEFYSPPITRSQSHTVSGSMKKTETGNDSSDDDSSLSEETFQDQRPKLNSPINRIHLEKESGSGKEEHMSVFEFHSPPTTRSKSPTVCDSPKRTEASKDNSDDDILFWEAKFKDQIFPDQSVGYDGITCRICEATFQTAEKCYLHASVHAWTNYYPCCVCNETFETEKDWKKHSSEHREAREFESREIMHDCNKCGKKFVSEARLKFHKLFHKSSAEIIPTTRGSPSLQQLCWNLNQRLSAETRKDPLAGNRILHNCEECDTVMDSAKSLEEHVLTSHKQQSEEQLDDHRSNRDRAFECTLGKRRFDIIDTSKVHGEVPYRPPLTENKFSCAHCGTTCTRKEHLIIHLRSHSRERPYSGNICSKKFATDAVRNSHSGKHTSEHPFKCSKCEKTFFWAESLKQHEVSHSGNVPWKCIRCDKSFTTARSRHNHLNVHCDRPYNCDPCESWFQEQRVVQRHEKIDRIKHKTRCKMESIFRNAS